MRKELVLPRSFSGWDQDDEKPVLQPSNDPAKLRAAAKEHAPALRRNLQSAVAGVPGAEVAGVRDEKDPERLEEKQEQKDEEPNQISDHLAGRIAVDSPEAKEQVVEKLRQQAPVIEDEDHFEEGGNNAFHSHNLQQQTAPEISSEIQIVPKEQAAAAERTHHLYERQRTAEAEGDQATSDRLSGKLEQANRMAKEQFDRRNTGNSVIQGNDVTARMLDDEDLSKRLASAGVQTIGKPIILGGKLFLAIEPGGAARVQRAQAKAPLAKGDKVKLKDGSDGTVKFVHSAMNIARVESKGKVRTVNLKDLTR